MLLQFSVANYRSIRKLQTLDFRATGLKSEEPKIDERNIVFANNERILKVIGIYGPNGSGKSNLLNALRDMQRMVRTSLSSEGVGKKVMKPFRLSDEELENSGFFQVSLLIEQKKFRYGFTLDSDGNVSQEWLFGPAEKNETWYFKRTKDQTAVNEQWFWEGVRLPEDKLRPDALYLNFVSAFHGNISTMIRKFIAYQMSFDHLQTSMPRTVFRDGSTVRGPILPFHDTNDLLLEGSERIIIDWLAKAGLHYESVALEQNPKEEVLLYKNKYNKDGKIVGKIEMRLSSDESAGTKKFYGYIGRLHYRFAEGGVFIVDEIDNNFHPSLLIQLVKFFNDPDINKAGAQLVFTSHDTNLLRPDILRRDQIYFTEKSLAEETNLYSLADLKGIRNNADFARQYLAGFYGALPLLAEMMSEQKNQSLDNFTEKNG